MIVLFVIKYMHVAVPTSVCLADVYLVAHRVRRSIPSQEVDRRELVHVAGLIHDTRVNFAHKKQKSSYAKRKLTRRWLRLVKYDKNS